MHLDLPFKSIGCIEGVAGSGVVVDHRKCSLMDKDHRTRVDAIGKCERCAKLLHHKYFAINDGGKCRTTNFSIKGERSNQKSHDCRSDGKGGRHSDGKDFWKMVYKRRCKHHLSPLSVVKEISPRMEHHKK